MQVEVVGRQQNLRAILGGHIGTPVFFCFNHSSRNAARQRRGVGQA